MANKLINYKFNISKGIQLNKAQLSRLSKDQLQGRAPVVINGREGFVGGDGFWTPKSIVKKRLDKQNIKMSSALPDTPELKI